MKIVLHIILNTTVWFNQMYATTCFRMPLNDITLSVRNCRYVQYIHITNHHDLNGLPVGVYPGNAPCPIAARIEWLAHPKRQMRMHYHKVTTPIPEGLR